MFAAAELTIVIKVWKIKKIYNGYFDGLGDFKIYLGENLIGIDNNDIIFVLNKTLENKLP